MEEACKVAREKMGKMNDYNKDKYDKKAKAVEMVIGDHVLMQNRRDRKGGTGKLASYWEHNIFEIIEKKEESPVYRIRNISKKSDVRVVHRNLLMLCNDLPLDVFKEPEEEVKTRRGKQNQGKNVRARQTKSNSEDDSSEDSDDDIVVVHPGEVCEDDPVVTVSEDDEGELAQDNSEEIPAAVEILPVPDERAPVNEDNQLVNEERSSEVQESDPVSEEVEPEIEDSGLVGEESEAEVEAGQTETEANNTTQEEEEGNEAMSGTRKVIKNDSGVEKVLILDDIPEQDEPEERVQVEAEEESQEEDDTEESAQPTRKSTRTRVARKIMTYNEPGGDPVLVVAKR